MSAPENPPAFPIQTATYRNGEPVYHDWSPGMTLRDYFAGQALANSDLVRVADDQLDWKTEAGAAYAIADAMLAERAK